MAKIYNDFQPANLMSFAKSFARLNGQPLDKSEIWYSLAEAQAYAATDAAYVGQILAVIDSEKNNVVFYGIQDAAGLLKEVGSAPVGDNLSIEIVEGKVQVRGFGKEYYAYVPAEKDEEGNIVKASEYVLTEGFKAGLEPRVIAEGEDLVIAWYEPGSETVEDVAANVEAVSKTVESLDEVLNAEGGLVDQVDELKDQVGQAADDTGNAATGLYAEIERINAALDTKANANNVYTIEQADKAIAEAVAGADHLKREIVTELPAAADADANTIYMVASGLLEDDNKYYEWILVDGVFEQVGSWEVDLSQYAKTEDVNKALDKKVDIVEGSRLMTEAEGEKLAALKVEAEKNYISSVANEFKVEEGKLELVSIGQDKITGLTETLSNIDDKFAVVNETLDSKVDAVEGSRLITSDEAKKLGALVLDGDNVAISGTVGAAKVQELYDNVVRIVTGSGTSEYDGEQKSLLSIEQGAEVNVIDSVSNNFTIDENRVLSLNDIPVTKVIGLEDTINNINTNVESLDNIINGYTTDDGSEVVGLIERLDSLDAIVNDFSANYVTLEDFNVVVGNLAEMKANNINILSDIEEIKETLQWKEIETN